MGQGILKGVRSDGVFAEDRAQPLLPSLIGQLFPKLNQVDPSTFSKFFGFHPSDGGIPARAGYYIGAVAAHRIAQGESLFSLAHMNAAVVRGRLSRALSDMERDAVNNTHGCIAHPQIAEPPLQVVRRRTPIRRMCLVFV